MTTNGGLQPKPRHLSLGT